MGTEEKLYKKYNKLPKTPSKKTFQEWRRFGHAWKISWKHKRFKKEKHFGKN